MESLDVRVKSNYLSICRSRNCPSMRMVKATRESRSVGNSLAASSSITSSETPCRNMLNSASWFQALSVANVGNPPHSRPHCGRSEGAGLASGQLLSHEPLQTHAHGRLFFSYGGSPGEIPLGDQRDEVGYLGVIRGEGGGLKLENEGTLS